MGVVLAALWWAAASRLAAQTYTPCLGCAEHNELRTRWVKPWLGELSVEAAVAADHYRLESDAEHLGLCENNPLIRVSLAINGCHAFSERRALLVASPLEVLTFVSPAWGLARWGHPRWAMAWQSVPIFGHALAIRRTTEAIHRWERQQALWN